MKLKPFTKKIGLYEAVQAKNANGQPTESYVFMSNRLASMEPKASTEKKLSGVEAVEEHGTFVFMMNYPRSFSLDGRYILKYRDRWFPMTGVMNVDEENRIMAITAIEVTAKAEQSSDFLELQNGMILSL